MSWCGDYPLWRQITDLFESQRRITMNTIHTYATQVFRAFRIRKKFLFRQCCLILNSVPCPGIVLQNYWSKFRLKIYNQYLYKNIYLIYRYILICKYYIHLFIYTYVGHICVCVYIYFSICMYRKMHMRISIEVLFILAQF